MKKETYWKMLKEAQEDVDHYTSKLEVAKFKLRAIEGFDKQELNELT